MGGLVATFWILGPALIVLTMIGELPPVKRWLNRLAKDMPMLRNS